MRLLVVDDEPAVCEVLHDFFIAEGCEVFTATDGPTALGIIKGKRPDVVLLDITMPGMDGMRVLEEARAIDPDIGIIMVSALRDDSLVKRAMVLGARAYIKKPVDLNHLRTSVLGGARTN